MKLFSKIATAFVGIAMAAGVGVAATTKVTAKPVKAESATISLVPNAASTGSSSTSYVTSNYNFTYEEVSWTFNQWNPSSLQVKTNQANKSSEFYFFTGKFPGKITSVVMSFSALNVTNSSGFMMAGSASAFTSLPSSGDSMTWDSTTKTLTWTASTTDGFYAIAFYQNGKVANSTNNLASEDSIVVTYEKEAGPTDSVTVSVDPISLLLDLNGSASGNVTATATTKGSATNGLKAVSGDEAVATVSTASPTSGTAFTINGVGVGSTTVTVTSTWDETVSAVVEVNVIDSTPEEGWIDATVTKGAENTYDCTVNGASAIRVGKSSANGSMSITVPSGATKLHFYAGGWSGKTPTISFDNSSSINPSSFTLQSCSAFTGSDSDFIVTNPTTYYFADVELVDIDVETTFTVTATTVARFVIWGVQYFEGEPPEPATYYSVTDDVENGSLDKSSVKEGANLVTTITPDSGYDLPTTVSVTMGGVAATVSYEAGVVTLNNVTGDVVVTATCPAKHGYSPDDPFTVAEAMAEIDSIGTFSGGYVSGIISQIDSYKDKYHSIDYWISDDGETTTQLECYSGKGIDGANFNASTDIEVGAEVVVTGVLKKYNSTYEFDYDNYQVSYVPPVHEDPTLTLSSYHTHLVNGGDSYVITASYESFSATPTLSVDGDPSYVGVTVSGNTITLSPTATGTETLTIRATYNSEIDTKDFKLVVTTNAGTAASPFTVEEAKAVIDVMENINANVVGVVSQVDSYDSSHHSITYWLSDDGTTTSQQLEVYSGKGYNGANFNEVGDMVTGTKVVVNGTLKLYNTTYEFDKNNKVVGFPNVDAFAQELLTRTDEVCAGYKEGDNNHDAIAAIWETLSGASYYGKLTSTEKAFIISVEGKEDGSTVEQAMARYDFLTARYELDNFISRSLSSVLVRTQPISNSTVNTNVAMIAVIVIAVTSLSAIGVLLVVKKRKNHI